MALTLVSKLLFRPAGIFEMDSNNNNSNMEQNIVYILQHERVLPDLSESIKFIGVFSTKEKAQEVVNLLLAQPGFSEYPDGFTIDSYTIDDYSWKEGFVTV